jgi:hypothetical protein
VGPGRVEKGKTVIQFPNSKTCTFRASKIAKYLLEKDQTTENIVQQQTLKKLLRIAHRNSNKTAVFKDSKNFMVRDKHHKIEKKIFKIHNLKSSI